MKAFGNVGRIFLEQGISVGYFSLVNREWFSLTATSVAYGAQWFKICDLPELKQEHKEIMRCSVQHLKELFLHKPVVFCLLPQSFTLPELAKIYEEVLWVKLDKSNFRSKVLKLKILNELKEMRQGGSHRKVTLYSFNPVASKKLHLRDFHFE